MGDCNATDAEYDAAVTFCVLFLLLCIAQFVVILILLARLKGIKVESEIKLYLLYWRNRIRDRIREVRENRPRMAATQQYQLEEQQDPPSAKVPDFPGAKNPSLSSPNHYDQTTRHPHNSSFHRPPAGSINTSTVEADYDIAAPPPSQSNDDGENKKQLIQSMAKVMRAGLKEVELKKEENITMIQSLENTDDIPVDIVFASYDMANETGQILEPQVYEEPVPLNMTTEGDKDNTGDRTPRSTILASYEVARDNSDCDLTEEYSVVDNSRPIITPRKHPPRQRTSITGSKPSATDTHKYVNVGGGHRQE